MAGFQVVTIMTTTGFATADFDKWTAAAKFMLLLLMIIGACAGSTGGAIKVVRLLLVLKTVTASCCMRFIPSSDPCEAGRIDGQR